MAISPDTKEKVMCGVSLRKSAQQLAAKVLAARAKNLYKAYARAAEDRAWLVDALPTWQVAEERAALGLFVPTLSAEQHARLYETERAAWKAYNDAWFVSMYHDC